MNLWFPDLAARCRCGATVRGLHRQDTARCLVLVIPNPLGRSRSSQIRNRNCYYEILYLHNIHRLRSHWMVIVETLSYFNEYTILYPNLNLKSSSVLLQPLPSTLALVHFECASLGQYNISRECGWIP